jgi:hypothetical protein
MSTAKYQHGSTEPGWMEQTDTPRTDAVNQQMTTEIPKLDPNTTMIFREGKGWQVLNQEEENQRDLDKIEEHLYWLERNDKHIEENELAKIRDVLTIECLSYLLTEIKKIKRKLNHTSNQT